MLTGLSCAVELAEIYMLQIDSKVRSLLGNSCWLYQRYIDDLLIGLTSALALRALETVIKNIDPHILILRDNSDTVDNVVFLDLVISISGDSLDYMTHHKPGNLHMFLPFSSQHAEGVKSGLVIGELTRHRRTCKNEEDFSKNVAFICGKFRQRGYPAEMLSKCRSKVLWQNKQRETSLESHVDELRPMMFKIQFFTGAEKLRISSCMRHALKLVDQTNCFRPITCFTSAPSLFVQRHRRFFGARLLPREVGGN